MTDAKETHVNAARLARQLAEDGVDRDLARSLAERLSDEIEQSVTTKDQCRGGRDARGPGAAGGDDQQLQGLRVELSDKLTMQFRWLLGWLALVTVAILLDLLR